MRIVRPDHDPVGVEEVVERRPLPEELRVRHDAHVLAIDRLAHHGRGAHRHRRLVDDDRVLAKVGTDLLRRREHVAHVRTTIRTLRCRDAQEHDVGIEHGGPVVGPEGETSRREALRHELVETGLDDRHRTRAQRGDAFAHAFGAVDDMTEPRKARGGRESDVTRSDHCDRGGIVDTCEREE